MCCETFRPRAHCGRLACCLSLALALLGAANRMPVTHEQAKAGAGKVVVGRRHENETFKIMMRQHTMSCRDRVRKPRWCRRTAEQQLWVGLSDCPRRSAWEAGSRLRLPWGSRGRTCSSTSRPITWSLRRFVGQEVSRACPLGACPGGSCRRRLRQWTSGYRLSSRSSTSTSSSWSSLWSSTARSSESRLLHLCTSCLHLPWSQGSKFYGCTECSHLIVQSMAEYMIVPVACRTNESETADRSTDEPYAGVYSHFLLSSAALLSTTFL